MKWNREESEAILEQMADEDAHVPVPTAQETPSSKPASAKSQSPGKRKSSAASETPAAAAVATSRDPRPLTAMQELL